MDRERQGLMAKPRITKDDAQQARVECFLLCNYAQAEQGKLHLIGGGWSEVNVSKFPSQFEFSVAIKIVAPAAVKHVLERLVFRLTQDDVEQSIAEHQLPLKLSSNAPAASTTDQAFVGVITMQIEIARAGRFHAQLLSEGHELAKAGFSVPDRNGGVATVLDDARSIPAEMRS
jgi:hypothetical protein